MPTIDQRTRSTIPAAVAAALLAIAPFATTAAAQQRGRPSTIQSVTPSEMGLHGYSVVLVIGDMQPAGSSDSVPSTARKALTDMQAFLPYKRYQLLDAAWMVCCGSFRSSITGRVRGPDSGEFQYSIDTLNGTDDKKLTVRFSMRDATGGTGPVVAAGRVSSSSISSSSSGGGRGTARGSSATRLSDVERAEHSRQLYEAIKERDEAEVVLRTTQERFGDRHPDVLAATARYGRAQRRVEDLQQMVQGGGVAGGGGRGSAGRSIMDSTFSIALGETVVIGTSRLKGDQALIALLTAATKPGAAR
jgi:hypothetical protein